MQRLWTAQEVAIFDKMTKQGKDHHAIAERLGRSHVSVMRKSAELKRPVVAPKPRSDGWSAEQEARLKEMRQAGVSQADIASALGRTKNAVIGACYRLGITLPKPERLAVAKAPKPKAEPRVRVLSIRKTVERVPVPERPECLTPGWNGFVTFFALEQHHCRWPIGNVGADDFKFCGARALDDRSYCAHHYHVAHDRSSERREWT